MQISILSLVRLVPASAVVGLLSFSNLSGQTFRGLGQVSDSQSVRISGISADGSVVVGTAIGNGGINREAFRWTSTGGIDVLGSLFGGNRESWARGVSDDGSIIVGGSGSAFGFQAFRWTSELGLINLGTVPGHGSYALSISGDGSTIVGAFTQSHNSDVFGGPAFRWTSENGFENLGTGPGYAYGVSENGSVIAGGSIPFPNSGEATRWTPDGTAIPLGPTPDRIAGSSAYAVSGDGGTMVGILNSGAALWRTTGEATLLDWSSGNSHAEAAYDVTYNGSIVVGVATTRLSESLNALEPFVWTSESGALRLAEILANDSSVSDDFAGWTLYEANAISPDGRFITGSGRSPDGIVQPWLLDRGLDPLPFTSVHPVPEPSTYGLIGMVMLGALIARRRWNTHPVGPNPLVDRSKCLRQNNLSSY